MSVRPCYSEDIQASAGTLAPCTGESEGLQEMILLWLATSGTASVLVH